MVDSQPITCVLCSEEATPRVVKDSGYTSMMELLWQVMKIDVKFTENIKFDLCSSCFHKIASFYDLNDATVIMEKRISSLTKELLKKNLEGIAKLKEKKRPILPVQDRIVEVYGTELEEDDIEVDDYDYEFEAQLLDESGKKLRTSHQFGGAKRSKEGKEKGTVDEIRKTTVTVTDLQEGETTDDITTASISSSRSTVRRQRSSATATKGKRKKKKSPPKRRKRLRRGASSSEEDEEDVYTSTSESEISNWSDATSAVHATRKTKSKSKSKEKDVDDDDNIAKKGSSADEEAQDEEDNSPSPEVTSTKLKYECAICLEEYPNETAYENHYSRHTIKAGEGFQCRCCREAFGKKQNLIDHLKQHEEGKYPCPVCHVMCDTETKIIQHMTAGHKNYWNRVPQIPTS